MFEALHLDHIYIYVCVCMHLGLRVGGYVGLRIKGLGPGVMQLDIGDGMCTGYAGMLWEGLGLKPFF